MKAATVFLIFSFAALSAGELKWQAPEYIIETGPLPYPCCYPEQFEATLGPQSGFPGEIVPDVFHTEILVSYDLPGKRWGFRARQVYITGDYNEIFFVEDYNKRTQSIWYNGQCTAIPLNTTAEMKKTPCIPTQTGKFSGVLRQGWSGKSAIRHTSWRWDQGEDWTFYVTVLQDKCVPVSEAAFIKKPRFTMVTNIDFYDFKTGLSEVPIFEQFSQADCKLTNKHMDRFDGPLTPEQQHFRKRFTSDGSEEQVEEEEATVEVDDDPYWDS